MMIVQNWITFTEQQQLGKLVPGSCNFSFLRKSMLNETVKPQLL